MELQALLVLCGVGVAGVAVLLLMSLFSSSGTSYEEAIAQQRKATTELLALAENKNKNNKKNSKKAIKKQAKKERKETAVASTGSDHESEAPAESGVEDETTLAPKAHVEFSPPVVVDISRDTPPNVKIRKRGKDPKVKPILLNKEDPSCVSDPAALAAAAPSTILNHFDEIHPKDEFELLQSSLAAEKPQEKVEEPVEKKEAKAPKPPKAPKVAAPKPAPPVEPVKEEIRERRDSGDAPKEQRKAKKAEKKPEKPVEEVVETIREEVVPPLNVPQPSELTTEKLLKQALVNPPAPAAATATPPGGKKKKKHEPNVLTLMAGDSSGVNVGELVRVVREAALSRTEIQILTDALLNKHHDPLPEHSEWTEGPNDPMQKLKKQLADKEKALADEVEASQALHAKLKELRGSLNASRSQLAAVSRAAEAAEAGARAELHTLQARLARLLEENHALAQDKIMFQQKLGSEAEVQAQRVQNMEMHIQRLSETEAALVSQLAALQAECGAHALEAGAARDSACIAQQHAADMAQQLQEANRACNDLEQRLQMALHAEQRAQQELRAAQDRLSGMAELQKEVQRLSSRAQAAEANAEKIKEEAEKQKQQLASEIASLSEQLALREAELAEVKQLKAVPAQNGLPAASEQHKAAELAKVESVVSALREELSAAQHCSRDQRDQLERLREQLQAYQDKNNELRTKNWKVMEALQSAEKALQTKASALPAQDLREAIAKAQETQYNEVASVLRTAFPSAAPAGSGRDWLQTFADNLKKELHKRETEKQELEKRVSEKQEQEKRTAEKVVEKVVVEKIVAPPTTAATDDRLRELVAQNEHLQGLVDKYKTVIDDTEGVLSRLQQNVSAEEQRWASQLADKQRELDELRQRTLTQEPLAFAYACIERSLPVIVEEMQSKIDALESQLAQAKATNHNHSFADAERLTEERLMAGLSDKHSLDVCNGPSQVGLEEK